MLNKLCVYFFSDPLDLKFFSHCSPRVLQYLTEASVEMLVYKEHLDWSVLCTPPWGGASVMV